MLTGSKTIFTAEPVQWAADYVLDILETLQEGATDSEYGLELLALEREELRGVWQELMNTAPQVKKPVFFAAGREGARLFVIRQLLSVLPARQCLLHDPDRVFQQTCVRLAHEYFFFAGFHLCLEKKAPPEEIVTRALKIIERQGLSSKMLLGEHPLHIYCLDYEMPDPAYYLYPSHAIVCGATDFTPQRQLHCLLHELGHVVYAGKQNNKLQPDNASRRQMAEQFANRFARKHLTPV
ncbi:ImmA/IrrE family metallo-endopeptidase [Dethiobacter alkaliphilus]|uniref:ImmA/IrrE family metallo-endopeptidase n=1 Tax=Dethiobacter alkaliphilus TaxID=427926 RepID=UPI002225F23A|nr:ImmA/IrrE family metallo-endopeptidase [Dethiobacter alkaliphilus]MCW3488623.1 ImmA/IrrE family metallo-endopeptidase [Dethiobacter alkaliphilus]